MLERSITMIELPKNIISDRKNWTYRLVRAVNKWGFKNLGRSHVEVHPEQLTLKQDPKNVFLYTGLHKSLWETTGILVALHMEKLPVPYAGMGDNLIRGKFFQELAKRTGVFLIKRATNRREILESAKKLKQFIMTFMAYGKDVIFFPEGTRKSILSTGEYGKFFPSAFDAVLEYEKEKETILLQYPELNRNETYIVPVNIDYSRVREDWEMIETYQGKPRTLHILDSLKMMSKVGDTYVCFGKPMKVSDYKDMSRKDLSVLAREKCLELVKILPINVVCKALVNAIDAGSTSLEKIKTAISAVVQQLLPYKERFRGFNEDDSPEYLLKRAGRYEKCLRPDNIDKENLVFYNLYANYIGHYF